MTKQKKIEKILLIVPPAYTFKKCRDINPLPPIGLGYIASTVESLGIEVNIFDCLVNGIDKVRELSGAAPPIIPVIWKKGVERKAQKIS